jgi:TonB family protein
MRGAGFGFDEAAVSAARMWRFQPGMKDGKPVVTEFPMTLAFNLRD